MSSNQVKVTGGALQQAAQSFAGHVETYNSVKSQLQSAIESSSSSHQGLAGNSFRQVGEEWVEASAKTAQALEDIQEKLAKAGIKFSEQDSDGQAKYQNINL